MIQQQKSMNRRFQTSLGLAVFTCLMTMGWASLACAQDHQVAVQTLAGEEITGTLKQLDDRQLVLSTAEGDRSYAVENLLQMAPVSPTLPAANVPAVWVELIDGSQLTGSAFTASDGRCQLQMGEQEVRVPVRMMGHVRLSDLNNAQMDQWRDAISKRGASDLLVVRAGDNLDYLEVIVKAVTTEEVTVEVDGEERSLERARVDGLVFGSSSTPEFGDPVCIVDAGTPIQARTIKLDGQNLNIRTQSGIALTFSLSSIAGYDFSAGKLMYLGDVEPDVMNVVKYLGPAFPLELEMHKPRMNQSPDGQPLTIDSQVYRKGLGLRSKTELIYRLRGKYSRFEAIAGIDDEVRGKGGHVQLKIQGDDKVLFDEAVDDARGAIPLSLDVTGVNRLTILVDFGENQGFADHLDLADARVVK